MAIKRITLSVPEQLAAKLKKAAGKRPVSAWVTALVEERLRDDDLERLWQEYLRDVAPTRAHQRRSESMLRRHAHRSRRRGAA